MTFQSKLEKALRRLGGSLVVGTVPEEFEAPFERNVGLDFTSKTLYATDVDGY